MRSIGNKFTLTFKHFPDRLNTAPCQVITNAGAAADKKQAHQNEPEDLALFFIIIVAQILKHI